MFRSFLLFALAALTVTVSAAQTNLPPTAAESVPPPAAPSLGHRLLMYLPNRVLDLADIFRCRLRVGPGLAAHVRATRYVNAYAGSYRSVYLGLPGPRRGPALRPPLGREDWRGLMLLGVDATDATPLAPGYSDSEFAVGAHLLLVGAEVGLDPVQVADFLAGLIGLDPRGDDR